VHGFSGGATGDGGGFDDGGEAHSSDCGFPKMIFPFLVILPGMIAGVVTSSKMHDSTTRKASQGPRRNTSFFNGGKGIIPPKYDAAGTPVRADGKVVLDYDLATPMMLVRYFPSGAAGTWALCADRFVHVGDGGKHDGFQHRLDVRHLSELHHKRRATNTTYGWDARRQFLDW